MYDIKHIMLYGSEKEQMRNIIHNDWPSKMSCKAVFSSSYFIVDVIQHLCLEYVLIVHGRIRQWPKGLQYIFQTYNPIPKRKGITTITFNFGFIMEEKEMELSSSF